MQNSKMAGIDTMPTATALNYYLVCTRKLWFFLRNIQCEQESDLVLQGKVIHETTYRKDKKEFSFGPIKIDRLDMKRKIIHEVKKSDKMEDAHLWQVKYYIYYLNRIGAGDFTGEIDYPKMKQITRVELEPGDDEKIGAMIGAIEAINEQPLPPPPLETAKRCRSCSYYELCFV